jgi:hypothetical protein
VRCFVANAFLATTDFGLFGGDSLCAAFLFKTVPLFGAEESHHWWTTPLQDRRRDHVFDGTPTRLKLTLARPLWLQEWP